MVLEGGIGGIGIEAFLFTYTMCTVIVFMAHISYFYDKNDKNDFYLG